MPELPEVEALAQDLRSRLADRVIVRVDLTAFSALKTFDPPLSALDGAFVLSRAFLPQMIGFKPPGGVYTHIVGTDIVRTGEDQFYVL